MARRMEQRRIYDPDTGEVLYDQTKPLSSYLFTDKGYVFHYNRKHTKLYHYKTPPADMTIGEYAYFIQLCKQADSTNALRVRKKPMSMEQIADAIAVSVDRTYRLFAKLSRWGMVKKGTSTYYINPVYGFNGKYLTLDLFRLFRADLSKDMPDWVVIRFKEMAADEDAMRGDERESDQGVPGDPPAGERDDQG